MSNRLSAFLHPVQGTIEKEVVVSDRFKDEDGNVVPFKIRAITQAENDEITNKSLVRFKADGQMQEKLDSIKYSRRLILAGVVEPDFRDSAMCEAYGVLDPLDVPGRMLLSGEYEKLMRAITNLSGFNGSIAEEVKNS